MKLLTAAVIAVVSIASPASADTANPIFGKWSANSMGGVEIEMVPCGQTICGTFSKFFREKAGEPLLDEQNEDPGLRKRPLIGVQFIEGMQGGPTEWTGGKVYYPNTGSFYDASLSLVATDQMKLKVCLGSTCREQLWTRVG